MKVYIVQAGRRGPIKIGVSRDFMDRVRTLGYLHKAHMMFLAVIDGGFKDEKALHQRFAHLALGGEWFAPGDDLMAYVDSLPCVREVIAAMPEYAKQGLAYRCRPAINL